MRVLRYLARDQLDVPFIEHYCPDYWHPELSRADLWTIDACDDKWVRLLRKRTRLEQVCLTCVCLCGCALCMCLCG